MGNWKNIRREVYNDKKEWLGENLQEVDYKQFYNELFPFMSFEGRWGDGKPNGIMCFTDTGAISVVLDDHAELDRAIGANNVVMAPNSYMGKRWTEHNASMMYGIAIDLDGVGLEELKELHYQMTVTIPTEERPYLPKATYLVLSGTGMHIYYFLKEPIELYYHRHDKLKNFKKALSEKIWNKQTSLEKNKEFQGIFQGFRMVGSNGKLGKGYPVRAYRLGEKVDIDYLNLFLKEKDRLTDLEYHSNMTLEEAKEKYPEWYERRIVKRQPRQGWTCKRALFDWWLRIIEENARDGNRYNCIAVASAYAVKCGLDISEVERFALSKFEWLNSLTVKPGNSFKKQEIKSALKYGVEKYRSLSISTIEDMTGVKIPRNKRNGHGNQREHLEEARAIRDIRMRRQGKKWDDNNGRKPLDYVVKQWRALNPDGTKKQCREETGLDPKTIRKWWGEPPRAYNKPVWDLQGWTEAENAQRTKAGEFVIEEWDK